MAIHTGHRVQGNRVFRAAAVLLLGAAALRAATFTVSPSGRDGNPGTSDAPMATLTAARDAAREAGEGPHRIVLMPGDHFLDQTLELDARDNGLTIEAGEGGTPVIYGGELVTGWKQDDDNFWSAELEGIKDGTRDFRALVVNGRMPPRARMPAEGTFTHKSVWNVRYLSNVAGGFERKGTDEELTTLLYDPNDIPATLEPRNAEVRVYHMWDESLVPVARNDLARHALIFAAKPLMPPGAFKVYKYVVFNTREGMTQPGQWYLDRAAGRVVYWPLPGEDMTTAQVVAPRLKRLISIKGDDKKYVEGITLRGLSLQATTTPIDIQGGFAAQNFDGALQIEHTRGLVLEKLEVCNVGGQGIKTPRYRSGIEGSRIVDCHIHDTGACGLIAGGKDVRVAGNHIHHVGRDYPSAVAAAIGSYGEKGLAFCRNEVHDGPYSGIIGAGENCLIEENLVYRVMREMHDGAAIYGGMKNTVLRGNIVRDVVAVGKGYGASAYYLDEGARDCLVERNVSVGVNRPTHNHIARNITLRDNVFISENDMDISANRSAGIVFERNTLFAPGNVNVSPPNAFTVWKDNVIFRNGVGKDGLPQPFTIDDAMPSTSPPGRRGGTACADRLAQPPVLDGEIGREEWPDNLLHLDRAPSRWPAAGAPVFAKLAFDDTCLYAAVNVPCFDATTIGTGTEWGRDDGVELAIEGTVPGKGPVTFVLRGFTGGAMRCDNPTDAPADAVARLQEAARFGAKPWKQKWGVRGGWRAEWEVPFEALGITPKTGLTVPFNLTIYRAEDEVWRCWEGTLGDSWNLAEAGKLSLGAPPAPKPQPRPTTRCDDSPAPTVDGTIGDEEWGEPTLNFGPDQAVTVWLRHDADALYVAFRTKVDPTKPVKGDSDWDTNDAVEVALRRTPEDPIAVLRGYPGGVFETCAESGAPAPFLAGVKAASSYAAQVVSPGVWTAEWKIDLKTLGLDKVDGASIEANFTAHRIANGHEWLCWHRPKGSSWALGITGGTVVFGTR